MANPRKRKPENRIPPTPSLRNWMVRRRVDNATMSRLLGAIGCETTPDGVRQAAFYRMPGHKLASALSAVTGIPYTRIKPLAYSAAKVA